MRLCARMLCLALALVSLATAQPTPETSRFRVLNDKDGLSQMSAQALAQDREGFLWVGTQVGLNRYDGAEFRTFSRSHAGLSASSEHDVTALLADPGGGLWVGTLEGLFRFDPDTERVEVALPINGSAKRVNALALDRDGALWIARDGGLTRYQPATGALVDYAEDVANRRVLALADDREGGFWVGTTQGLLRLRAGADQLEVVGIEGTAGAALSKWIQALCFDHAGALWIGTKDAGLMRLDPASGSLTQWQHAADDPASLSHNRIYALLEDSAGLLWLGTEAGADLMLDRAADGADKHAGDTARFVRFQHRAMLPATIGPGRVVSLMQDAAGDLLFGTWAGGASLLSPVRSRFLSFEADSSNPGASDAAEIVNMTHADGEHIWLGSRRGLFSFDVERHQLAPIPATVGLRTYAVAKDGDTLLLGSDQGVHRYDPRRDVLQKVALPAEVGNPFVDFIIVDRDRIWISTRDADLFVLDRGLETLIAHHVMDSRAHFMSDFDADSKILGGDKGLYWFSIDGKQVEQRLRAHPSDPDGLRSDTCHFFLRARDGQLWLATAAGLHRMDMDASGDPARARFVVYRRSGGASANSAKAIVEDSNGRLWVSSNAGIGRFDPQTTRFNSYGAADGAIDRGYYAFVYAITPGGHVAFGGASGFTVFQPDAIADLPPPPRPLLAQLEIDNRILQPQADDPVLSRPLLRIPRLVLPAGYGRSLGLTFAAAYFAAPEHLRFAYRLDGFSEQWIETDSTRRLATYTNLAPGHYVFRVRARTADNDWSGQETRLPIVIEPFWWQTSWFRIGALFALVAAMFALFQARLRWLAEQRQRLADLVAERTTSLQHSNLALEAANARIEQLSQTDFLTGLGNRRAFHQCLPPLLRAVERGEPVAGNALRLAFVLIDIDEFKSVNDRLGHGTGDRLLAALGSLLREHFPAPALVVRWGGEEFLAVLPVCNESDALVHCERVRAAIQTHLIDLGGGATLGCTASLGFACHPFDLSAPQRINWEQALEIADHALYAAKQQGRNRAFGYVCAGPIDRDFASQLRSGPQGLADAGWLRLVGGGSDVFQGRLG